MAAWFDSLVCDEMGLPKGLTVQVVSRFGRVPVAKRLSHPERGTFPDSQGQRQRDVIHTVRLPSLEAGKQRNDTRN